MHVDHADGEAKLWLEPTVEVAANYGLNDTQLNEASKLVEEHLDEIRSAWVKLDQLSVQLGSYPEGKLRAPPRLYRTSLGL